MYEKRYSNMADSERTKLESDVEDSYDIYPHPTVRVIRPKVRVMGHSSWKDALTEVTRRRAFLGALAVLVFVLLLLIVIVLLVNNQTQDDASAKKFEAPAVHEKYGLFSVPSLSEGGVIRFKPDDYRTFRPWMNQLEDVLQSYSPHVQGQDKYDLCELKGRGKGKQCAFHISDLGHSCGHAQDFGFSSGRPCILLSLKLPFAPGMVKNGSDSWNTLYKQLGIKFNPSYVGITCDGKTKSDQEAVRLENRNTPVTYYPDAGFPVVFFPSDISDDKYLAPLVMVQFSSLKIHTDITVQCIAWAQNEQGTLPQTSELYKTEFKIAVE